MLPLHAASCQLTVVRVDRDRRRAHGGGGVLIWAMTTLTHHAGVEYDPLVSQSTRG
jgi:hypothetical protein